MNSFYLLNLKNSNNLLKLILSPEFLNIKNEAKLMKKMPDNNRLSYRGLLVIEFVTIVIAFVAFSLVLNYNESFYMPDTILFNVFLIITEFGDILIYMLLISCFYYAYDKRIGKRLALCLLLSGYLIEFFKNIYQDPRPQNIETVDWDSYGFPSGHSSGSAAFYGYIGYSLKDKLKYSIIPILMSLIIMLIALSRVIIGVHDLQDIAGGLILGIGFLLAYIHLHPILNEKYVELDLTNRLLIALLVPTLLFIIGSLVFPFGDFAYVCGFLVGVSVGFILENEKVNYEPSEIDTKYKIINLVIGLVILSVLYYLIGELTELVNYFLFEFLMYSILGFVFGCVSPLIFTKINKTSKDIHRV